MRIETPLLLILQDFAFFVVCRTKPSKIFPVLCGLCSPVQARLGRVPPGDITRAVLAVLVSNVSSVISCVERCRGTDLLVISERQHHGPEVEKVALSFVDRSRVR